MSNTITGRITVEYGVFAARAIHRGYEDGKWTIDLPANGLGYGVITAANENALNEAFRAFIDDAMEWEGAAYMDADYMGDLEAAIEQAHWEV